MSTQQPWPPHITVACVVEREGRYLLVREHTDQGLRLNQPAGHLEPGETLLQAAVRECLEETGWAIELTGFVGLATYLAPANGVTYLRVSFAARALQPVPGTQLDDGIVEAIWLSRAELEVLRDQWRSPLVGEVIDQYHNRGAAPLELVALHR